MKRLLAATIATAVSLAWAMPPATAATAGPGKYNDLLFDNDLFWNYDNTTTSGANSTNVDWPVSLVFWNNAEVDKIKFAFDNTYTCVGCGGAMHLYLNDARPENPGDTIASSGPGWDSDSGTKEAPPVPCNDTRHFRMYADSNDRMYTTALGYYVIATTHKDFDEFLGCGAYFRESEQTERHVGTTATALGYNVNHDYLSLFNNETNCARDQSPPFTSCTGRQDAVDGPDHIWQNSGYGTYVNLP